LTRAGIATQHFAITRMLIYEVKCFPKLSILILQDNAFIARFVEAEDGELRLIPDADPSGLLN
jgi:hypothetical protein